MAIRKEIAEKAIKVLKEHVDWVAYAVNRGGGRIHGRNISINVYELKVGKGRYAREYVTIARVTSGHGWPKWMQETVVAINAPNAH
jgi:hypothetical protein